MSNKVRNLVTGGAGFLGSHLIDKLLEAGEDVICIDNFFSGNKMNLKNWSNNRRLKIIECDVNDFLNFEVDKIWHLACSASPKIFYEYPIETSKTNFIGTYNVLELARKLDAKILFTSSSEVYGNPEVHPQHENYKGSVNSTGRRSCYEEGKRIAESLCFDFYRKYNCNIKVARIFNTYGPRMGFNDGRVISNFISQALTNLPLTIYGDGNQTRSFCYVDDLVRGLLLLMESDFIGPVNLGNPKELKIIELAEKIRMKLNPKLNFTKVKLPKDDPIRRKPNIELAIKRLNWKPVISIDSGLERTINYFKDIIM